MKKGQLIKVAAISVGFCLVIGAVGIGIILQGIDKSTDKYIQIAQNAHPWQSDVSSMIAYINSDKHSLIEKNHMVWALGRVGDTRAYNALEHYYTGGECSHEKELCQKELKKALDRCRG